MRTSGGRRWRSKVSLDLRKYINFESLLTMLTMACRIVDADKLEFSKPHA